MPLAIHECKRCLYLFRQERGMCIPDYFKTFKNNIDVVEHNGGNFGWKRGS